MRTVWILDRSEEHAAPLSGALPSLMYDVTVWTSAANLLSGLRSDGPDLVVVEHGYDEPPAVEVIRTIRSEVPRLPIIVVAERTSEQAAIESMREGAYDYLPRGTLPAGLEDAARRALSADGGIIRTVGSPGPGDVADLGAIIGRTPEMVEIHKLIGQVATTDAAVLIHGEPGTGKELIARAIHYNSERRDGPFVAVNCSALPSDLLEVDLFGRGRRDGHEEIEDGRFEQADGGTIFLDEIDRTDLPSQGRILSVLENGWFERPGTRKRIPVDVRVIASTGRSLVSEMKEERFRVDLFYRLKVVSLYIPPLRERRDDIPYLAEYFLERAKVKMQKDVDGMSEEVVELLQSYPWPGNVRELEQAIHRAIALSRKGVLVPDDFEVLETGLEDIPVPDSVLSGRLADSVRREFSRLRSASEGEIDGIVVGEVERALAEAALEVTDGNQVRAAKLLGISRNTLRKRVKGDS
ncbi:MAG: AAA domain-containing protein [Candidatus Eisenbacteria bacterium]|nr:AAA domain-containing protein [Candidatus Eisenbacteria bacterium]